MLGREGVKCRTLSGSHISVDNQSDAVSSCRRENREHDRNKRTDCKTDFIRSENENPGALAGATGVELEAASFKAKDYPKAASASNRKSGNIIAHVMSPRHKRMSRMLGYSLLLGTPEAWQAFGLVAAVRLSADERTALAAVCLATLSPDVATSISAAVIGAAGDPLPPFLGDMADARDWASWASRSELKAYALAAFEAMAPADKAGFYRHIGTVEVAA